MRPYGFRSDIGYTKNTPNSTAMDNSKLLKQSLLHALAAVIYVAAVASIMKNGERLFGEINSVVGPIAFLLLFVFSAAMMGALVMARPLMLYLDGDKAGALRLFSYIIGWLFLATLAAFVFLVIY